MTMQSTKEASLRSIKEWLQGFMTAPETKWVVPGLVGGALLGGATGLSGRHGWGSMLGRGVVGAGIGAGLGWGIPKLIQLLTKKSASTADGSALAKQAFNEAVRKAAGAGSRYSYLEPAKPTAPSKLAPAKQEKWKGFQRGMGAPGGVTPQQWKRFLKLYGMSMGVPLGQIWR